MSPKKIDLTFNVAIVLFLVWVLWQARGWPLHSKLFPWFLEFSVLPLAVIQVFVALRAVLAEGKTRGAGKKNGSGAGGLASGEGNRGGTEVPTESAALAVVAAEALASAPDQIRPRVITIYWWIVTFFLGIWLLGFKVGSLFLTFAFLKFTANEKWSISTAIAVGTYLFFLVVFDIALRVPLHNGFVADYLGLDSLDSYILMRPILRFLAA